MNKINIKLKGVVNTYPNCELDAIELVQRLSGKNEEVVLWGKYIKVQYVNFNADPIAGPTPT